MSGHPIDLAIVDNVGVVKGDVRGFVKARDRLRFGNAADVRDTKLTGQFGGVYVASLKANFDLDTLDTTTADDGVNCIIDFDGNRFKRVVAATVKTQRAVTAAGAVVLADDCEDIIVINKTVGAATTVYLPDWSVRTTSVKIVDGKYDALTNNITLLPKAASGQTIMGGGSWIIDSNGGSIELTPFADGSGSFA